jgi:hypothetical protein
MVAIKSAEVAKFLEQAEIKTAVDAFVKSITSDATVGLTVGDLEKYVNGTGNPAFIAEFYKTTNAKVIAESWGLAGENFDLSKDQTGAIANQARGTIVKPEQIADLLVTGFELAASDKSVGASKEEAQAAKLPDAVVNAIFTAQEKALAVAQQTQPPVPQAELPVTEEAEAEVETEEPEAEEPEPEEAEVTTQPPVPEKPETEEAKPSPAPVVAEQKPAEKTPVPVVANKEGPAPASKTDPVTSPVVVPSAPAAGNPVTITVSPTTSPVTVTIGGSAAAPIAPVVIGNPATSTTSTGAPAPAAAPVIAPAPAAPKSTGTSKPVEVKALTVAKLFEAFKQKFPKNHPELCYTAEEEKADKAEAEAKKVKPKGYIQGQLDPERVKKAYINADGSLNVTKLREIGLFADLLKEDGSFNIAKLGDKVGLLAPLVKGADKVKGTAEEKRVAQTKLATDYIKSIQAQLENLNKAGAKPDAAAIVSTVIPKVMAGLDLTDGEGNLSRDKVHKLSKFLGSEFGIGDLVDDLFRDSSPLLQQDIGFEDRVIQIRSSIDGLEEKYKSSERDSAFYENKKAELGRIEDLKSEGEKAQDASKINRAEEQLLSLAKSVYAKQKGMEDVSRLEQENAEFKAWAESETAKTQSFMIGLLEAVKAVLTFFRGLIDDPNNMIAKTLDSWIGKVDKWTEDANKLDELAMYDGNRNTISKEDLAKAQANGDIGTIDKWIINASWLAGYKAPGFLEGVIGLPVSSLFNKPSQQNQEQTPSH